MRNDLLRAAVLSVCLILGPHLCPAAPDPAATLKLEEAALLRNGQVETFGVQPDSFGPGIGSMTLHASSPYRAQLRFKVEGVPEGDYVVGLLALTRNYMNEFAPGAVVLYHNDRLIPWAGYSIPVRPDNAAEKIKYQTELHADKIHLKPGDSLRVVGGTWTIGPMRLYTTAPEGDIEVYRDYGHLAMYGESDWINFGWDAKQRDGALVTQSCWFYNPGTLPHTFALKVDAVDYWRHTVLSTNETITLPPGGKIQRTFQFATGDSGRIRLALSAASEEFHPDIYSARYFIDDRTAAPRPRVSLNGEWEMCFAPAPGVGLGIAPPADAVWTNVVVPSLQTPAKLHCGWYRKQFTPPAYLNGERYVIQFEQIQSEARVFVNGKEVHYQFNGAHPFEADVTEAFKPGQPNEILIGVRDWLAYSPKNRDRVTRGEEPVIKDGMTAPSGYIAMGCWGGSLGIGKPVWIEARPAVAVEDVAVVTSVREKKLRLQYTLANKTGAAQEAFVTPCVLDVDKPVKTFKGRKVAIPAGQSVTLAFEVRWSDPRMWEVGDPYLYTLQTDVQPVAGTADRHRQRFGFREMWIDGYHFTVNGRHMNIRSKWVTASSGDPAETDIEQRLETLWERQMGDIHNRDLQLTRTHNQIGVEEMCDIADESGLMMKVENGDVCQQNFNFGTNWWNNIVASEVDMVKAYRHHASVFMWSAGNENWLWNWVYQGEAARTLGHKLTVAVAKEMTNADYMRRPVEWESDADLMGEWDYYALHYSRELASAPYLPNAAWWGPLDGKTTVDYHGPLILGSKPITSGETFCPGGQPHIQSLILGDDAYLGGNFQWRGWNEGARFLVNGMRDVEMALLDTYTSMSFQKAQTIVFKEETASFFGGQTITRSLNVHSDVPRSAKLLLRWSLTPDGEAKPVDSGRIKLKLAPAELAREQVRVKLPSVTQPLRATFRAELLAGDKLLHTEMRTWQIHPALALQVPATLTLSVYDPEGQTIAALAALKVPFERLAALQAPEGRALLLGRDALRQPPPGSWREGLASFVRKGGKLVVLEQTESPDFLPAPVTLTKGTRTTIAFARAADHPLLAGLTDADLRWWAPDHLVSSNNYRKPVSGNFVPVVDMGTTDGMLDAGLIEEYDGQGSYILCQMPFLDKATTAPAAARLLQNLLNYLAAPRAYRTPGATALLAAESCTLRNGLDMSRLVYDDLSGKLDQLTPDAYPLAIVDASSALNDQVAPVLRAYAEAGGHVMIHGAAPDKGPILEALLGMKLVFSDVTKEPGDVQNRLLRRDASAGLIAGLSNHDFFWATLNYLNLMNGNGKWWGDFGLRPPEERIVDFYCRPVDADAAKAIQLTRPCALLQVPVGKGYVLLSQLRLDQPMPATVATIARMRSILLTDLGATLRGSGSGVQTREQRLKSYSFFQADLSKYANRGLRDDKEKGITGWSNQQENDMRGLPTGLQTLAGVPFFIASPKGVVALYSEGGNNKDLPREVKDIEINHKADLLYFLHAFAYGAGEHPFLYRVNYSDGMSVDVPIRTGCHVLDWWRDPNPVQEVLALNNTFVAFRGDNPMRKKVTLFGTEWTNPSPEKEIRSIDFLSVSNGPVALLAGISGAMFQPAEGVVEDVMGTEGVKVRLGTQLVDVYYIGVAGLPATHAYYEAAVKEHKALAVGKKVTIVTDVITQNAAGQRIAYVFAGPQEIQNMLNAQALSAGLGNLGNFEGNNRHRDYLNNLAFIATQNKKGIWATEKK